MEYIMWATTLVTSEFSLLQQEYCQLFQLLFQGRGFKTPDFGFLILTILVVFLYKVV